MLFLLGSSPRVWGQVGKSRSEWENLRIIPTRMGTRIILISLLVTTKDHPHAYGDKSGKLTNFRIKQGSSPRVWGQVERRDTAV